MATEIEDQFSTESMSQVVLRTRERPNDWFEDCAQKLRQIATLQEGWDSYGAKAPSSLSLNYAHAFLHYLRDGVNVPEPCIAANAAGNVCFEWDDELRTLTTEIDDSGVHHFYYEYGDDELEIEDTTVDFTEVIGLLTKI